MRAGPLSTVWLGAPDVGVLSGLRHPLLRLRPAARPAAQGLPDPHHRQQGETMSLLHLHQGLPNPHH